MASNEQLSKDNWKATVSLGFDSSGKRIKQKNITDKQSKIFSALEKIKMQLDE